MSNDRLFKHYGNPPTKDQGYAIQAVANEGESLNVVGEYYREKSVERACDKVGGYGWAVLRPEPNNKHDANAVAVHVGGNKVGFLRSDIAAAVQASLLKAQEAGKRVACPADFDDPGNDTIQVSLMVSPSSLILDERQPVDWQSIIHTIKILGTVALALVALLIVGIILRLIYLGFAWVVDEVVSFFRLIF